jgi:hypothetical protein
MFYRKRRASATIVVATIRLRQGVVRPKRDSSPDQFPHDYVIAVTVSPRSQTENHKLRLR